MDGSKRWKGSMKPPDPPGSNDAVRVIVLVALGVIGFGVTFVVSFQALIDCRYVVKSDIVPGQRVEPCDYSGAVGTVAQAGIVLLLGVGLLLGAHRSTRATAIVSAAIVIVVVLSVRGLLRVPLG